MSRQITHWLMPLVFGTLGATANPTEIAAQGLSCGEECFSCGPELWGRQGVSVVPGAGYNILCYEGRKCLRCRYVESASESGLEPALLERIQEASAEELATLVDVHGERLLLHEPRSLLAVIGTGCAAGMVSAVVVLTPEKAIELRELGLRPLGPFLSKEVAAQPKGRLLSRSLNAFPAVNSLTFEGKELSR